MATNNVGKQEDETEFGHRLANLVVSGFTAMGIALGRKLGLFNILSTFDSPATAKEIADTAGYKERYVKEWLGQMAVSDILQISSDGETFFLPKHRREAMDSQPAIFNSHGLPLMGKVVGDLTDCFKKDGPRGLPFELVKEDLYMLYELQDHRNKTNPNFTKEFVDSVPGLAVALHKGIKVIELGCGRADLSIRLAQMFPNSNFIGLDFCQEFVDLSMKMAKNKGVTNIEFICDNIFNMPREWSESFDYALTEDVVHDLPYPDKALAEIERILKADGIYSVLEINAHSNQADNVSNPLASPLYGISMSYCMTTSLSFENGMGLGACMGIEKLRELLKEANLKVLMEGSPPAPASGMQIHVVSGKMAGEYPEFTGLL